MGVGIVKIWSISALLAAIGLAMPAVAGAQTVPMQHAFLVQNSGWMEPFYIDTQSQLKPLVAAVAHAVAQPQDTVSILAFNQSAGQNVSPKLLSQSRGAQDVAQALQPLQVARKGDGSARAAMADTDFKEAVVGTITGPFQQAPGILWIFTNNKNSPNNDAQTRERNRDFYSLLHTEPSITKTLAFPLRMPVQGKLYQAHGLMVYALAYGEPAAQALERIMAKGRLSQVLTKPPARLKPIDQEAVRIVPQAVKDAPHIKASLGSDQRTVVLDVEPASYVPQVTLQASLQNLFFPYAIEQAAVSGHLHAPTGTSALAVVPPQVSHLQPGATSPVEVSFQLPMAQVPSAWSMQALSAMGKQVLMPMSVELQLQGQNLSLSETFRSDMEALFPGDPISEVFTPPTTVNASKVQVPLLLRVQYPLAPVIALIGAGLLLLLGFVALGLIGSRSKRFDFVVDGNSRSIVLKPFSSQTLCNAEGQEIGEVRRGLGAPKVVRVNEGHTLVARPR